MKNSHIEWTHHTFNAWIGCQRKSPACKICYIERSPAMRFRKMKLGDPRVRTSEAYWKEPLAWNRDAEAKGIRYRVFCLSLGDWLDDEVPIEWLADLLKLIHDTPHLDWLLLTKRPENWYTRLRDALAHIEGIDPVNGWDSVDALSEVGDWLNEWLGGNEIPANVWIGVTVEDNIRANERIPLLKEIPATVRFLSCEPMLEPLDLGLHFWDAGLSRMWPSGKIHWVIAGGESGPGARPMHPAWAQGILHECQEAGVAFFFKQWGDWCQNEQMAPNTEYNEEARFTEFNDGTVVWLVGKKIAGRLLNGRTWDEYPKVKVTA